MKDGKTYVKVMVGKGAQVMLGKVAEHLRTKEEESGPATLAMKLENLKAVRRSTFVESVDLVLEQAGKVGMTKEEIGLLSNEVRADIVAKLLEISQKVSDTYLISITRS